jgi:hypothetical protein
MNNNEIKKALYKEKPIAMHNVNFVETKGERPYPVLEWGYYTTTSLGTHYFRVPLSEMGETPFEEEVPAQLLIRWLTEENE